MLVLGHGGHVLRPDSQLQKTMAQVKAHATTLGGVLRRRTCILCSTRQRSSSNEWSRFQAEAAGETLIAALVGRCIFWVHSTRSQVSQSATGLSSNELRRTCRSRCIRLSLSTASGLDNKQLLKPDRKAGSGNSLAISTSWPEGSRSPGQFDSGETFARGWSIKIASIASKVR